MDKDPAEARKLVDEMLKVANGDLYIGAKAEFLLQGIASRQGKLDEAEAHCDKLMNWYTDPKRMPSDPIVKSKIDQEIRGTAAYMLGIYTSKFDWSTEKRLEKIHEFEKRYLRYGFVKQSVDRAIKNLNEIEQRSRSGKSRPELKPVTTH